MRVVRKLAATAVVLAAAVALPLVATVGDLSGDDPFPRSVVAP
ncbi:hypothetical protein [Geodermatophilus sp. SYSU D00815]